MEEKYFNRYRSFCRSLRNLEKSKFADPTAEFVLEGTIRNYILTFDLAWKVMKDILVKQLEITDFAIGSPREVLQSAFTNGLISDDIWLKMLKTRNLLAHDLNECKEQRKIPINRYICGCRKPVLLQIYFKLN